MSSPPQRRVLIYAQHLSGVGHYVRTYEIARSLTDRFEVHWIEGGRPVPHRPCPQLAVIELPRIRRGSDGRLEALDADQPMPLIHAQRRRILIDAIARLRPDVFLVEYFPFSKWELAPELLPAIRAVRRQGGMVLCSIRDIVRQTRFEVVEAPVHAARILDWLGRHFDGLLVHADPDLIRLEESFPAVQEITLPIFYTGIVSEKPTPCTAATATAIQAVSQGNPYALLSTGGSSGGGALIGAAIEAWRDPTLAAGRMLVVCSDLNRAAAAPLLTAGPDQRDLRRRVRLLPFRADFLHWLAAADLSISQCGYNTAANLLETGIRAVVSPHPLMSDQQQRAACLAGRQLIGLSDGGDPPERLRQAIAQAVGRPRPQHNLRLDGARDTAAILSALLAGTATDGTQARGAGGLPRP